MASITKNVVVVTGLAGAGKSTVSRALSEKHGWSAVMSDNYRYVPGTWNKLPAVEFLNAVYNAINASPSETVIVDSTYNDPHDPEHARMLLIDSLASSPGARVYIFKPATVEEQASMLVDRCIRRATGEDTSATSPETYESRGKLLAKNILHHEENVKALDFLASTVAPGRCTIVSRDDLAGL